MANRLGNISTNTHCPAQRDSALDCVVVCNSAVGLIEFYVHVLPRFIILVT